MKERYRGKIQLAYYEPDYKETKGKLLEIIEGLKDINLSASRSIEEGLEETLTLHRLGLVEDLGKSLTTTNIIKNMNSGISRILRNIKFWRNSSIR
jgi:transposase-like protein